MRGFYRSSELVVALRNQTSQLRKEKYHVMSSASSLSLFLIGCKICVSLHLLTCMVGARRNLGYYQEPIVVG